jgi:uncharacterized membrane protein
MRTVTGRIEIARPVEEVFDFVADERNEPRYNEEMLSCEKVTSGPVGVGTRYAAEMKAMGSITPMTIEVTGYEKPVRLASWSHIAGTMDIRGAVTFEAIPNGTLMSWRWDLEPHGCVKLLGPMVTRMGRHQEERIWTSLKTLLEGEPQPAAANT